MAKKTKAEVRDNTFEKIDVSHTIQYIFTEEELKSKSKELANAVQEEHSIEMQKKETMSEFKNKLDSKIVDIDRLSNHISSGYYYPTVKCRVLFRPDQCIKEFYYEGKLYETTKMTGSDFQVKLEMREDDETIPVQPTKEEEIKDIF